MATPPLCTGYKLPLLTLPLMDPACTACMWHELALPNFNRLEVSSCVSHQVCLTVLVKVLRKKVTGCSSCEGLSAN